MSANEPPIVYIFRHNLWANLRLFDACMGLNETQLNASVTGTYGGIHDTLTHIVIAEERYLTIVHSAPFTSRPQPGEIIPVADLRERVRISGEGLIQAAGQVNRDSMVLGIWGDGTQNELLAVGILTQAINHATEHRAQVMTILTQQGVEPPDLSGWSFMDSLGL